MYLRLPTSLAAIFGAFTLGLYVAIQGPTLMDLIDLLHVNNDIMSYSLAFASLAYSVGGLMSGFLFNYVNRQMLIAFFLIVFGTANIATPYIGNYLIFSVITVFKMMCAGGTDCGTNVWILEMWPGQDAWLQALHFSFAVGCALGPLIVEPFLSVELKGEMNGSGRYDDQNESRIHIPYAVSGVSSICASMAIIVLYRMDLKHRLQVAKLRAKQQAASGEHILMTATQHPAAIEAGLADGLPPSQEVLEEVPLRNNNNNNNEINHTGSPPQVAPQIAQAAANQRQQSGGDNNNQSSNQLPPDHSAIAISATQTTTTNPQVQANQVQPVKITSKAREQLVGRPPYYVMFAIGLAALCLSFYCGIEITSMNYLATFAVNIDLQLPKATAALMSSALTISFAVGRGFGIYIAAHMKPHRLFYLCSAVMALGNVSMLIFANTAETLLWCSICLFGIGCGPMFPAIVSFYDDRISKVTNTVSGIFISGSMFNVALNSLIIGHHIIDNALILIVCNLIGSVLLLLLFGTLHMLTKVKKNQRVRKFKLKQQVVLAGTMKSQQEQQVALLSSPQQQQQQANTSTTTNDTSQPEQSSAPRPHTQLTGHHQADQSQTTGSQPQLVPPPHESPPAEQRQHVHSGAPELGAHAPAAPEANQETNKTTLQITQENVE